MSGTLSGHISGWPKRSTPEPGGIRHPLATACPVGCRIVDAILRLTDAPTSRLASRIGPTTLFRISGCMPRRLVRSSLAAEIRPVRGTRGNHHLVSGVFGLLQVVETALLGVLVVEPEPIWMPEGFFGWIWNAEALMSRGLDASISQASTSWNEVRNAPGPALPSRSVRRGKGGDLRQRRDLGMLPSTFDGTRRPPPLVRPRVERGFPREPVRAPRLRHGYVALTDNAEVHYLIRRLTAGGWNRGQLGRPDAGHRMAGERGGFDRDASLPLIQPDN